MVSIYTAKVIGWVYILVFTIAFLLYGFYSPTASIFEDTYERNYNPTDLYFSQRWSPQFFYVGSVVFLCLVPLTLAFALDDTDGSQTRGGSLVFRRFIFHLIMVVILMIWFGITVLIFGSINWANANRGEASNAFNMANDRKWCCFYFTLETGCFTKTPCNVGGSITDLTVNGVFLFYYWFGVAFIVLMLVDVLLVLLVIKPAYHAGQGAAELAESLIPMSNAVGGNSGAARAIAYKHRK
jgi:hypothetical protein